MVNALKSGFNHVPITPTGGVSLWSFQSIVMRTVGGKTLKMMKEPKKQIP